MSEGAPTSVPDPHANPAFAEPGLPPNPSVGELVTEIDRARTGAARTAHELREKLDPRRRFGPAAKRETQNLRWDGRRILADLRAVKQRALDAAPQPVATGVQTVSDTTRRVPIGVPLGVAAVLMTWRWRRRKRAKAAAQAS